MHKVKLIVSVIVVIYNLMGGFALVIFTNPSIAYSLHSFLRQVDGIFEYTRPIIFIGRYIISDYNIPNFMIIPVQLLILYITLKLANYITEKVMYKLGYEDEDIYK